MRANWVRARGRQPRCAPRPGRPRKSRSGHRGPRACATETPPSIRLEDYRPSDFLIDRVDLDVRLDPQATRITATLALRPNPAGEAGAALHLDGDDLALVALDLGRRGAGAGGLHAHRRRPQPARAAAQALHADDRHRGRSQRQHQADGPLPHGRRLLHPVRGRRLPPDHLLPRPARRDGGLYHPDRGAPRRGPPSCSATATSSRPGPSGTTGTSRSGTTRTPSPPTCSPWSAAASAGIERPFTTMEGRAVTLRRLRRARQGGAGRLRPRRGDRLDGLGRDRLRPRLRSRCLQRRRRLGLQHGGDGEQGPQRLQRQVRARLPGDPPPMATMRRSRRSSRTSTSTTGRATASPAATGSSSASRRG